MSYAQHNCSSLVASLRANSRALKAEFDKCRIERQQLHRKTLDLIRKELDELQKEVRELDAKLDIVWPPPSTCQLVAINSNNRILPCPPRIKGREVNQRELSLSTVRNAAAELEAAKGAREPSARESSMKEPIIKSPPDDLDQDGVM